jgi:uncharacterized surface protein with fasciclin (FAS1) repeats
MLFRTAGTAIVLAAALTACQSSAKPDSASAAAPAGGGLAAVMDEGSQNTVVKIAAQSPDHTTLVAAVQAAGLVDVLANSGPYTVFAPTNAAFEKLPAGTVDNLLKPENLSQLQAILRHHVTTSVYEIKELKDGEVLGMADGTSATISRKGEDVYFGDAKILGSARGSNGIVLIIDAVVPPPAK